MRRALMILLFAAGCGGTIETTTQPLKVAPIDGLPAYDGGRVLHPWHSSKPARERFAQVPIAASASDADCLLGDERFDKCLVFDCEKNPCPTGTCWDVTVMHDPEAARPLSLTGTEYRSCICRTARITSRCTKLRA